VRDSVAKLVGRAELAGRARAEQEDGQVDDGPGQRPSAGLDGNETALSRDVAPSSAAPGNGDAAAELREDEPVVSRRALMSVMRSWRAVQAWAAQLGTEGAGAGAGERGCGTKRCGSAYDAKRWTFGFGRPVGTKGQE
jgi:hypothetical protein